MATEKVDLIFGGDPSDAVNAAKQVEKATNDVGQSAGAASEGFLRIGSEISQMKGRIKGIAIAMAAFTASVFALLRPFRNHVLIAKELSENLEISAEKAQELALAEKMAGLEAGTVRDAIESIAEMQAQGMVGGISDDFSRLGVSLEDIRTKRADEIFDKIADNAKGAELGLLQINSATKVLGSDGVRLLKSFSENFGYFRDEAKASGKIISEETFDGIIQSSTKMFASVEIAMERLVKSLGGFQSVGEAIASTFDYVSETIENVSFMASYISSRFSLGNIFATDPGDRKALYEEASMMALEATTQAGQKTQRRSEEYVTALGQFGLTEERAKGAAPLIEGFKKRAVERSQNIDALQRVGLAQTAGASESLKIQRAMLGRQTRMVDLLSSRL